MRGRATASLLALALILAAPQAARPDYTYQGALLQPLATVDPVLPGQFFDVWRPGHLPAGSWSLGGSAEALRNSDNSDDWETILSVTGAYGLRDRLAVGLIVPYIARDPEFNESELLDLKTFAR
ncbi:MAG: hypothetical protein JSV00_08860 [bacterium]|nr:MAG: hypothetical protein JSV00_08860 [bacterium]